jgi:hypothetical protein
MCVWTYDCYRLNVSMRFIGYFFACTWTLVITIIPTVCGMCFCTWPVLNFSVVFSSSGYVRVQHCVTRSNAISFHKLPSRCRLLEVGNMTGNENSVQVIVFESCWSYYLLFKNSSPSFLQSRFIWHESFKRNNGRNLSNIFDYCDIPLFHV